MSPYRKPIKEVPLPAEYYWPEFPVNEEAEKTILGAILLDNADFAEARKSLTAEDFSLDSNRRIFLRMSELMERGISADIVTLANEMARHKENDVREIQTVGGVAYLASLTEGLPRRPVIGNYIAIVKEKAFLRRIIGVCEQATSKANEQHDTAAQIVKFMGENLKGIKEQPCKPAKN
jgi:replicative DNA helicase